jgi:hypothetical protein
MTLLSPFVEVISSKSLLDSRVAGGMVSWEKREAGFPQIMSTLSQRKKPTSVSQPWNYSNSSSNNDTTNNNNNCNRRIYNSCPHIHYLPRAPPPSLAPQASLAQQFNLGHRATPKPYLIPASGRPLGTSLVWTNSLPRVARANHSPVIFGCHGLLRMVG